MDDRWGNDDGVILNLDKLPGTPGADPNIYTNNPGDPEQYRVSGGKTIVKGALKGAEIFPILERNMF